MAAQQIMGAIFFVLDATSYATECLSKKQSV